MSATRSRRSYHHGDLRAALVDVAVELIAERGVRDFSLAEASRRLGVTVAAPYRHFAGRDELLAAVAVRGLSVAGEMLAAAIDPAAPPGQQLAALADGYVRFAAGHRALFEVLLRAGLDKSRHPELQRAADEVSHLLLGPARALGGDGPGGDALAGAVLAAAHGHAALLLDGMPGTGGPAVTAAAARARATVAAIVAGRAALA